MLKLKENIATVSDAALVPSHPDSDSGLPTSTPNCALCVLENQSGMEGRNSTQFNRAEGTTSATPTNSIKVAADAKFLASTSYRHKLPSSMTAIPRMVSLNSSSSSSATHSEVPQNSGTVT